PPPDPGSPPEAPLHRRHGEPRDPGNLRDRRHRGHAARGTDRGGRAAGRDPGVAEPRRPAVHPRGTGTRGGSLMEERTRVNVAVGLFVLIGVLALGYRAVNFGRVSCYVGGGFVVPG